MNLEQAEKQTWTQGEIENIGGLPGNVLQAGNWTFPGVFSGRPIRAICTYNSVRILPLDDPNYKFEMDISPSGIISARIVTCFETYGKRIHHPDLYARLLFSAITNYFIANGHEINGVRFDWVKSDYLGDNFWAFHQYLYHEFGIENMLDASPEQLAEAALYTKTGTFAQDINFSAVSFDCCSPNRINGVFIR